MLKGSLVDVEIHGARLVGTEPDPTDVEQVVKAWSEAHPDHHIMTVRYLPHHDETSVLIQAEVVEAHAASG